jgi:hypothetical protein
MPTNLTLSTTAPHDANLDFSWKEGAVFGARETSITGFRENLYLN